MYHRPYELTTPLPPTPRVGWKLEKIRGFAVCTSVVSWVQGTRFFYFFSFPSLHSHPPPAPHTVTMFRHLKPKQLHYSDLSEGRERGLPKRVIIWTWDLFVQWQLVCLLFPPSSPLTSTKAVGSFRGFRGAAVNAANLFIYLLTCCNALASCVLQHLSPGHMSWLNCPNLG